MLTLIYFIDHLRSGRYEFLICLHSRWWIKIQRAIFSLNTKLYKNTPLTCKQSVARFSNSVQPHSVPICMQNAACIVAGRNRNCIPSVQWLRARFFTIYWIQSRVTFLLYYPLCLMAALTIFCSQEIWKSVKIAFKRNMASVCFTKILITYVGLTACIFSCQRCALLHRCYTFREDRFDAISLHVSQ